MKQINCIEIEGIKNLSLNLRFQVSLYYNAYYKTEIMKFSSPSLIVKRFIIELVKNSVKGEYK